MTLNGIMNMTFTESKQKENKKLNLTTKLPELDKENGFLFKAADILESLGNVPGLTANEFTNELISRAIPTDEFSGIALAAVSIETMMTLDLKLEEGKKPTVH